MKRKQWEMSPEDRRRKLYQRWLASKNPVVKVRSEGVELSARPPERPSERPAESKPPILLPLLPEFQMLKDCREAGLFEAFVRVVKNSRRNSGTPGDLERLFLSFLRTAVKEELSPSMLCAFGKEFPGELEFRHAQGIGMVLSDGRICRFIRVIQDKPQGEETSGPTAVGGNGRLQRTRDGYVPAESRVFLEALLHSWGDKGREMRAVPLR